MERYDSIYDKWTILPEARFPKKAFSMCLVVVKKRYIYSIGEADQYMYYGKPPDDSLYKLDT